MMTSSDWVGLSGLALVWMLLAMRLPFAAKLAAGKRILYVAMIYCAVMLPLFGLSLAGLLRGLTGDLSITSLLLLVSALWERLRYLQTMSKSALYSQRERNGLLRVLAVVASVLYPCALGLGSFDPYRLGFASVAFILALAALALGALYRGLLLLPMVIALAVSAWSLDAFESRNLWDYLIDVPLALYAIAATLRSLLIQARRGKSVQTEAQ